MLKHYHREKDINGNDIKYKNQSIDKDLTYLNKSLIERDITDLEFIHRRMEEVQYQDRKDLNVMADWIITAPEEYRFTDQEKKQLREHIAVSDELKEKIDRLEELFKTSFEILKERYGEKNIINCCIHYDETTPHIHFAFMPIIMDQKKIRGKDEYIEVEKLNAKKCLSKMELSVFHKEVQKELDSRLFFKIKLHEEIEQVNEETGEIELTSPTKLKGNRSINQLKKENAILEYENKQLAADRDTLVEEMEYEKRLTDAYIEKQQSSLNKISEDTKSLVDTYLQVEQHAITMMNDIASIEVPIEEVNEIFKLENKKIQIEETANGSTITNKKGIPILKVLFTTEGWDKLQKAVSKVVTFFKNFKSVMSRNQIMNKDQERIIDEKPASIKQELELYRKRTKEYKQNIQKHRKSKSIEL